MSPGSSYKGAKTCAQLALVAEAIERNLVHATRRLVDEPELFKPMKLRDNGAGRVLEALLRQRIQKLLQRVGPRLAGERVEQDQLADAAALVAADVVQVATVVATKV